MDTEQEKFIARVPEIDITEGTEMLTDFSREAQRHLFSARNSLLVLESVSTDKEAIDNIFKMFHTIKGLADFLQLHDICFLTNESEIMMDMVRKNILDFEPHLVGLITNVIDSLQKLLELLDEQLANGGKLKSPYFDVSELIRMIRNVTSKKVIAPAATRTSGRSIPTINFEPDMTVCTQIEEQLKKVKGEMTIEKDLLQKLIQEFQETSKGLKEAQSKLHERQRELIKERELAIKLTQHAQQEARAKSEYLANMSHEIRTLINAILGFTDLLRDSPLGDKQREHVNTIILSGKMLLEIVNNILDFSKVEAGKLKLEQIDFNLEHITEEVFKIIRTRLNRKPINLYYSIGEQVPRNLIGDPTRLKQIFINLLDNAIKFTDSGEIGLDITIDKTQKSLEGEQVLRFSVRDSGIGIPEDRQVAIFESFTQAHDSTTRIYGGTGLGLALCKTFVENMKGKIWVESDPGKGSRFVFLIKFREGTAIEKTVSLPALTDFAGTKIAIVDCHENSALALKRIAESEKFNVLPIAHNAKEATELLIKLEQGNESLPSIVFIDAMLPGKEGIMLAYRIRQQERYQKVKLVAVSSDVKLETSEDFRVSGFDFFLAKPIIKGEVTDVILRLLGYKSAEQRSITPEMLGKISCGGVRVIVVEDSVPNQELLKVHFETLGCVCDYVSNGQEAIEKLKQNQYDICFMDLQMPIMGGIDATRFIRNELKLKLPIIALTAAEIQEEKDRCFEVGMNDYLPKPFDIDELKQKIVKNNKM